jgi:UDP-glucose 4-epimerase
LIETSVVTGGAGFIGSHLVDRLAAAGRRVVVIDNFATGKRSNLAQHEDNAHVVCFERDIADAPDLDELIAGGDELYHLAALADIVPSIERPTDYYRANVTGTLAVVDAARRAGIKRVVYAASSSCYGFPDVFPTPETAAIRPQYPYALTKYLGECLALHWGAVYGTPTISLRFFNVYGPRARTSGTYGAVFGVFLAQKLAGKPFTVVGDGTQKRDFTYVDDAVDALVAAARSSLAGEVLNVGSGGTYSINHLTELLGGPVEHIPKRPGEPDRTFADISKARELLGYEPQVRFEQGVARVLAAIDQWRDAPVWDAQAIAGATQAWFEYLGPNKAQVAG